MDSKTDCEKYYENFIKLFIFHYNTHYNCNFGHNIKYIVHSVKVVSAVWDTVLYCTVFNIGLLIMLFYNNKAFTYYYVYHKNTEQNSKYCTTKSGYV